MAVFPVCFREYRLWLTDDYRVAEFSRFRRSPAGICSETGGIQMGFRGAPE
ncbi:hypothetical protein [Succinimonas amylolytica]|uniref:hypothetical protein n=1 Tax=Succinimonas amylolytica TaxID=83769 RepID=UPI0023A84F49